MSFLREVEFAEYMSPYEIGTSMISAIFDFDGVLVDSRPVIGICLAESFQEFGIDGPNQFELSNLIGPPLEVGLSGFLTQRGLNTEVLSAIMTRFRESYAAKSIKNTFFRWLSTEHHQDILGGSSIPRFWNHHFPASAFVRRPILTFECFSRIHRNDLC